MKRLLSGLILLISTKNLSFFVFMLHCMHAGMPMPDPNVGMLQPHAASIYGGPPPMPQPGGGYPSSGLSFGVSMQ